MTGLGFNGTNVFTQTRSRCVAPGGIDWTGIVLEINLSVELLITTMM